MTWPFALLGRGYRTGGRAHHPRFAPESLTATQASPTSAARSPSTCTSPAIT
jgi:hypothetical protein